MSHPEVSPTNDVMGFIYATIGVVYSVMFAFVMVTTWQQFEDARAMEDAESHAVADLFRLLARVACDPAGGGAGDAGRVRPDDGRDRMATDGGSATARGTATLALIDRMWRIYGDAATGTASTNVLYTEGVDRLAELGGIRRERLHVSRHGIPGMLWTALIIGAVVTVGFAAGFSVASWVVHAWLVAALAAPDLPVPAGDG